MSLDDYSERTRQVVEDLGGKFSASTWAERYSFFKLLNYVVFTV